MKYPTVFPAPAGINRQRKRRARNGYCVPRASGDKPQATFTAGQKQDVFPAPAGIKQQKNPSPLKQVVLPALAGMNHHITRYLFLKFLY